MKKRTIKEPCILSGLGSGMGLHGCRSGRSGRSGNAGAVSGKSGRSGRSGYTSTREKAKAETCRLEILHFVKACLPSTIQKVHGVEAGQACAKAMERDAALKKIREDPLFDTTMRLEPNPALDAKPGRQKVSGKAWCQRPVTFYGPWPQALTGLLGGGGFRPPTRLQ